MLCLIRKVELNTPFPVMCATVLETDWENMMSFFLSFLMLTGFPYLCYQCNSSCGRGGPDSREGCPSRAMFPGCCGCPGLFRFVTEGLSLSQYLTANPLSSATFIALSKKSPEQVLSEKSKAPIEPFPDSIALSQTVK